MCLICAIVEDLVEKAQADLQEGRWNDVGEALLLMRMQITGKDSLIFPNEDHLTEQRDGR
jgi:hypothetical protein